MCVGHAGFTPTNQQRRFRAIKRLPLLMWFDCSKWNQRWASYPRKPTTAERFCRRRGKLSRCLRHVFRSSESPASRGNFIPVCWLCWPKIKHLGKACHLCHCARRLDCGMTAQGENKACPIFVAFRFHCVFLPSSTSPCPPLFFLTENVKFRFQGTFIYPKGPFHCSCLPTQTLAVTTVYHWMWRSQFEMLNKQWGDTLVQRLVSSPPLIEG